MRHGQNRAANFMRKTVPILLAFVLTACGNQIRPGILEPSTNAVGSSPGTDMTATTAGISTGNGIDSSGGLNDGTGPNGEAGSDDGTGSNDEAGTDEGVDSVAGMGLSGSNPEALPEIFQPVDRGSIPVKEAGKQYQKPEQAYLRTGTDYLDSVEMHRIQPNLWMHVSYTEKGDSLESSNGLVLFTDRSALLIDTPGSSLQTLKLLNLIRQQFQVEVDAVILTGSEPACTGGIALFEEADIPIYAQSSVAEDIAASGRRIPMISLTGRAVSLVYDKEQVVLVHPGIPDQLSGSVAWLPGTGTLYARDLLFPDDSRLLATLNQQELLQWHDFLERWMVSHDNTVFFVPKSGDWGPKTLFDFTMARLSDKLPDSLTPSAIDWGS